MKESRLRGGGTAIKCGDCGALFLRKQALSAHCLQTGCDSDA